MYVFYIDFMFFCFFPPFFPCLLNQLSAEIAINQANFFFNVKSEAATAELNIYHPVVVLEITYCHRASSSLSLRREKGR